jgi:hypothetical protein
MFVQSLQRRAFGVELWAVIPSKQEMDRTYFVRVHGQGHIDRHFGNQAEAWEEFFGRVRAALVVEASADG